eukprot:1395338-Amorphochlora_amoeboformis.AAC.5
MNSSRVNTRSHSSLTSVFSALILSALDALDAVGLGSGARRLGIRGGRRWAGFCWGGFCCGGFCSSGLC